MYWPSLNPPKAPCITPANTTVVNTNEGLPSKAAYTPAKTTTIGPVGPETCEPVPPNSEAKKPTKMAP